MYDSVKSAMKHHYARGPRVIHVIFSAKKATHSNGGKDQASGTLGRQLLRCPGGLIYTLLLATD